MKDPKGWVLFDGQCRFCIGAAKHFGPWLNKKGFELAPLQTDWVRERLKIPDEHLLDEMRVITNSNQMFGGADALLYIARSIWWTWPLYAISFLPGMKSIFRRIYKYIAARRNCISGACAIEQHSHRKGITSQIWPGWIPLLAGPSALLPFRSDMPAWAFMWSLSFAVFVGFKWLTLWQTLNRFPEANKFRLLLYFFFWPGMDAEKFISSEKFKSKPEKKEYLFAVSKFVFGVMLFWGVARMIPAGFTLIRGWIGLIGLAFLLHFGSFHLLALIWQQVGIPVSPIMKAPILSVSLSEFWSHRWNLAFRHLANRLAFQPFHKSLGVMGAMSVAFLASGLIHELVISVPARGCYGFPTMYFLFQAAGMAFEKSFIGQRIGLTKGLKGWLFTMLFAAGPAFWLFHPPFIKHVVIPFMEAVYAL